MSGLSRRRRNREDARPDLLTLLARVRTHVYSGEMLPDGSYLERFAGPGLEDLLGAPVPDGADANVVYHAAIHPDDWDAYLAAGTNLGVDATVSFEYRLIQPDRSVTWVLERMWVRERLPSGSLLVDGVISDVTELHARTEEAQAALELARAANRDTERARNQLERATAWLRAAVVASPAAIIMIDPEGRVQLWNPAAERMFGWRQEEVLGKFSPHVPAEQEGAFREILARVGGGEDLVEEEVVRRSRDGSPRHLAVSTAPVRGPGGEITGFMGILADISRRKELENRLRRLAHTDSLTGLANRVMLMERIGQCLADPRPGTSTALLLLDLDGFKKVNDSFGHETGDELLAAAAQRIRACVRTKDLAARLGGDEFAVLIDTDGPEEAMRVAERIRADLGVSIQLRRADVVVTASIGMVFLSPGRTPEDLLRDADVAMYTAKDGGKDRVVLFRPRMQEQVAHRLRLETELRQAVESGEFDLHYQPIVNLLTGGVVGAEALLRWRHPSRGLLVPADFLPVAQNSGLIVPIGQWATAEACRQAGEWQLIDPTRALCMSVNLSPRQLRDPQLLEVIARSLTDAALPPGTLTVEITEELLVEAGPFVTQRLAEIRNLGVRVAIDDFGTGYSSLAYLRDLPVDILKIDRSFVAPLGDGPRPAALLRAVVQLAEGLGLDTVAEGVETEEQAATVKRLGCQTVQGYLFGRPGPAAAISARLAAGLAVAG